MTSGPIRQASADGLREIKAALIGKFDVVKPLGDWGPCAHYLAHDLTGSGFLAPGPDNRLILKVLHDSAARAPRQLELFYLEAEAASKLHHRNIIRASRAAAYGGVHYAVSECRNRAKSLRHLLDLNAWLDPHVAISLACQIAAALDYAQKNEALHLKLSPEVILVEPDGTVFMADFGIGAQNNLSWAHKERSGRAAVRYISPEQAAGDKLDYRSDLYSLGVLLFEMLTDRTPFDSEDPHSIKRKHIAQTPLPPHGYRAAVPKFLSAIVMELLEKRPEARIQSGATLASLMESLAHSEGRDGIPPTRDDGQAAGGSHHPPKEEVNFPAAPGPTPRSAGVIKAEAYKAENLSGLTLPNHLADIPPAPGGIAKEDGGMLSAGVIAEARDKPDELVSELAPESVPERVMYESPVIAALNATPDAAQVHTPVTAVPHRLAGSAAGLTGLAGRVKAQVNRLRRQRYAVLFIAAILIPACILALAPTGQFLNNPSASPGADQGSAGPNAEASPTPSEGEGNAPAAGAQIDPAPAAQGETAGAGKEAQRANSRRALGSQGSKPKQYVRRSPYKPRKLRARRHRTRAWRWMPLGL